MLKEKVLKEVFVTVSYGMGENISTFLVPGRYADDLLNGDFQIFLSDGVRENANTYQNPVAAEKENVPQPSYLKQNT
jgi:hypothetical protein